MSDVPPPPIPNYGSPEHVIGAPPEHQTLASHGRSVPILLGILIGLVGGLGLGRYALPLAAGPVINAEVRQQVAAEEFCALGDGEGASLLDIAGWTIAADRVNSDWDGVLRAIDERCPEWRQQIAAKAAAFGD